MNEKNNNILVSLIAIALLISIIFGAVALFKRIDETISDIDKGTTSTDKNNSSEEDKDDTGSDTGNNTGDDTEGEEEPEEDPDFYLDSLTNTGYATVDGYTYFFMKINKVSSTPYLYVDVNNWANFSTYTYKLWVSTSVDGNEWDPIINGNVSDRYVLMGDFIYLSYAKIQNCTNPAYVLEDLNQNVFFNKTYFNYTLVESPG